jgi:hypothetical protein
LADVAERTSTGRWDDVVSDDSRVAVWLHYASLAIAFVLLAYQMRRQWFFSDDYQVLAVTEGEGLRGLFRPFAEHWMTVPKLLAELNFAVVGFRTYWPTLLIVLALHLLGVHLLWRLLRQMGVAAWIATGLAAAYAVSPGNALTFSILQAGWFGAIAIGLFVIMLADHDEPNPRRDALAAGLVVLNLVVHSGVAIAMLVPATLVALLRRGVRGALVQAAPAAVAYGIWYLIIGHDRPFEVEGRIARSEVPRFAAEELVDGIRDVTPLRGPLAVLLVVGLAVWLVWRARLARTAAAPAWAMAIGAVTIYVVVGLGRGYVTYRYAFLEWMLLLPAIALVLHEVGRRAQWRMVLGVAAGIVLGLVGLHRFNEVMHAQRQVKQDAKQFILGAAELATTAAFVPEVLVNHDAAPNLRARHLAEWGDDGKFADPKPLTEDDRREITPHLQVRYVVRRPANFGGDEPPLAVRATGASASARGNCVTVEPAGGGREVELSVRARASISVAGVERVLVRLPVIGGGDGPDASSGHSVPPDRPEYLEFAAGTQPVLVLPPGGTAEICGVGTDTFVNPRSSRDLPE